MEAQEVGQKRGIGFVCEAEFEIGYIVIIHVCEYRLDIACSDTIVHAEARAELVPGLCHS